MWMEFLKAILILTDQYRVSLPTAMAPPAWAVVSAFNIVIMAMLHKGADPGDRAFYGGALRPHAYWDCGFESRRGHGCLCLASVVCCVARLEVSATVRCLVQRSLPSVVCVCVCVLVIKCNNSTPHWVDEKTSDYARSLHKRPEWSCYYHGFVCLFHLMNLSFLCCPLPSWSKSCICRIDIMPYCPLNGSWRLSRITAPPYWQ